MLDGGKHYGKNRVGRGSMVLSVYNFKWCGWCGPHWKRKVTYEQRIEVGDPSIWIPGEENSRKKEKSAEDSKWGQAAWLKNEKRRWFKGTQWF